MTPKQKSKMYKKISDMKKEVIRNIYSNPELLHSSEEGKGEG
jgi:hypothetical protein